jgi:hypothetical protein
MLKKRTNWGILILINLTITILKSCQIYLSLRLRETRDSNFSPRSATLKRDSKPSLAGAQIWNFSTAWWCFRRETRRSTMWTWFSASSTPDSLNLTYLSCLARLTRGTSKSKIGMGSEDRPPYGTMTRNSWLPLLFKVASNSRLRINLQS